MDKQTCVLIGHHDYCSVKEEILKREIINLTELGVRDFLCGGMGHFDSLCASIVRGLKRTCPDISCTLVIPYLTKELEYKKQYYDSILYPEYKNQHYKARIRERNRYMVEHAMYALCYVLHTWGGAAQTLEYAKKRGLTIINLGDSPQQA